MICCETRDEKEGRKVLLQDEVAIVTGGGRGIGRAIARRFAAEGAKVVITARTHSEIEKVADEVRAAGGVAVAHPADLSKEADCESVVAAARKALGPVTILVNDAGILGPVKPVEEISSLEWDQVLALNLRTAFLLCKFTLPEMYARKKGCVLNVLSVAAKAAFQCNSPYAASKAALAGLTRSLAAEAAQRGVRVNGISPGPVPETQMSQELGKSLAKMAGTTPEKILEGAMRGILQGRAQTAEEIASAALFLVSNQASAITGQILNVDGGMVFY
jgi:NAD(P)-dependent dehydrogenase (short-subunit alcohol dehydrogenase family)